MKQESLPEQTKNTFGTPTELEYHTTYTAPSDGYLVLQIGWEAGLYVYVDVNGIVQFASLANPSNGTSIGMNTNITYIKKGMTMYMSSRAASGDSDKIKATFYPLV